MRHLARTSGAAAALAAIVLAAVSLRDGGVAHASVPVGPPTFTTPLTIDNPLFPVVPGAVKVYRGTTERHPTAVVDIFLDRTRDFGVGVQTVPCRVLQETEFESGDIVEISTNYFAQADDHTVYYFGETVDTYEDGVVVGHTGSWLVGGAGPGDPPETVNVAAPTVFMPLTPAVGDQFRQEDFADGTGELDTVRRLNRRVRVPAGRFTGCVEIGELNLADGERETKWYAPGAGVVLAKARREVLRLEATTVRPR